MSRPHLRFGAGRWGTAALAALLLASAGCTSDWFRRDEDRRRDDPLLGGGSGRAPNQPLAVATAGQPQPNYTPTPPPVAGALPPLVPATPTSNAALASGAFQPLPGGSDLRIGSNNPNGAAPAGGFTDPRLGGGSSVVPAGSPIRPVPQDGAAAVVPAGSGAVSPIRPVNGTAAGPAPATATAVPTGAGMDQLMRAVGNYRPLSTKLTSNSQTGEWRFEASLPARGGSGRPVMEGTGPTPEAAVRLVLEQLAQGR